MPFDPNGAIHWQGQYHLGYIFQDERGHCWGHASSIDLLHWRFHPAMLAPNPGDVDRGIFSGNAFVDRDGRAVALYHGVGAGNCIATSTDADLKTWHKLPSNPIVPIPRQGDEGFGIYESWDPHGWFENDTYYAVFGGHKPTVFRAKELDDWSYVGPLLDRDLPGVDEDEDISCPDLFRLGDKHILLCISHRRGCRYYIGHFDGTQFHAESHHRMNWPGGTCFAPESLLDAQGRRIFWAWVLDRRPVDMAMASGWSGVMTLPRVLTLDAAGVLGIRPPAELTDLRYGGHSQRGFAIGPKLQTLPGLAGDCMELAMQVQEATSQTITLEVRRSPAGEETTAITYDHARGTLSIDVSRSTLDPRITYDTYCMRGGDHNPRVTVQEAPFQLREGEPLRLRVFLDASILEVFANDRQCLTQRIYPSRPDSMGVALRSGEPIRISSITGWSMRPTVPW
jgi:sucrose-6-phosphate hydrolase SacC (GH32 family)